MDDSKLLQESNLPISLYIYFNTAAA